MAVPTIRTPQPTEYSEALTKHYLSQVGGGANYPVFRGGLRQTGGGIGNIFGHIGRWLLPFLPVAIGAAKTFLSGAAGGLAEGKSIKEAAKTALAPTIKSASAEFGEKMANKLSTQTGSGRRKRRRVYKSRNRGSRKSVFRKRENTQYHKKPKKAKRARFLLHPTNF